MFRIRESMFSRSLAERVADILDRKYYKIKSLNEKYMEVWIIRMIDVVIWNEIGAEDFFGGNICFQFRKLFSFLIYFFNLV